MNLKKKKNSNPINLVNQDFNHKSDIDLGWSLIHIYIYYKNVNIFIFILFILYD